MSIKVFTLPLVSARNSAGRQLVWGKPCGTVRSEEGVGAIAHEETHRYLDTQLDASGKAVMRRAEANDWGLGLYSKGGALVGVTDGKRAAQEAAAEYVAYRTTITLDTLAKIQAAAQQGTLGRDLLFIEEYYDARAKRNTFGYDMVAGDSNEYRINKNMSPETEKRCWIQRCSRGALVTTSHIMLC